MNTNTRTRVLPYFFTILGWVNSGRMVSDAVVCKECGHADFAIDTYDGYSMGRKHQAAAHSA